MIRLFVLVEASAAGWLGWKLAERFGVSASACFHGLSAPAMRSS